MDCYQLGNPIVCCYRSYYLALCSPLFSHHWLEPHIPEDQFLRWHQAEQNINIYKECCFGRRLPKEVPSEASIVLLSYLNFSNFPCGGTYPFLHSKEEGFGEWQETFQLLCSKHSPRGMKKILAQPFTRQTCNIRSTEDWALLQHALNLTSICHRRNVS